MKKPVVVKKSLPDTVHAVFDASDKYEDDVWDFFRAVGDNISGKRKKKGGGSK